MSERLSTPRPRLHAASVSAASAVARFKHKLTVSGEENLEKAESQGRSFMLGPNHRSFWDPVFLSSAVNRVLPGAQIHYMASNHLRQGSAHNYRFSALSQAERYYWPAVVSYFEAVGTFWVDRSQNHISPETLEHLRHIVRHNGILSIFPEGSRNIDQPDKRIIEPKKVKAGVGAIAAKFGLDIVPVGIAGADEDDRTNTHVYFGEMIQVEARPVDLSSAKSIVAATRGVRDQLYEGMSEALAIAYNERQMRLTGGSDAMPGW